MNDPLLTVPQVAEKLAISPQHVYRLTSQHRMPFIRLGGSLRFRASDIDAWLEAKTVAAVK